MRKRELIIIGGGPGGLSAAVYAKRYMLDVEVISRNLGGTILNAHEVCNVLTYQKIKGIELAKKMEEHVNSLNIPITIDNVLSVQKNKDEFIIKTSKEEIAAKKVIFGVGTAHNRLNAKGEGLFAGKGVSYCATCDGPLFRDKYVAVVGGGNAALTSALMLSEHAKKVYLIHRRDEFRAEPAWVASVQKNKKIELLLSDQVLEISGSKFVESAKLKSGKKINIQGIFIEVGSSPKTEALDNFKLKKDKRGFLIVNSEMETSEEGLFAVGDVVSKQFRQVVTAMSDGAVSAVSAYNQLRKGD